MKRKLRLVHTEAAPVPAGSRPTPGAAPPVRRLEELSKAERLLRSTPDSPLDSFPWEHISVVRDEDQPPTNDSIAFASGPAEVRLRQIIAAFGFPRMPQTYGELRGLLDYCALLETAAGFTVHENPKDLEICHRTAFRVMTKYHPGYVMPFQLFINRDIEGLRAWHTREGLLERLGREFEPDADEDELPLLG